MEVMSHVDPMFCRFYLHADENVNYDIISEVVNKTVSFLQTCAFFRLKNKTVHQEIVKTLHASESTIMLHSQSAYECMAMVYVLKKIEQPTENRNFNLERITCRRY